MSKASFRKGRSSGDRTVTYKYLDVVFDSELNWNENISVMLKKSQLADVYCLRKTEDLGSTQTRWQLYIMLRYALSLCLGLIVGVGIILFQNMTASQMKSLGGLLQHVCVTVTYVCECVRMKSNLNTFALGVRMKSNLDMFALGVKMKSNLDMFALGVRMKSNLDMFALGDKYK